MREVIAAVAFAAALIPGARAQENAPAQADAAVRQETQQAQPTQKAKAQLARAYKLKAAKKNVEAIAAFEAVVKADPENRAAIAELGYLHAGLKHWSSAAKYLAAASKQDPSDMRLHMDLGYAKQALKDVEGARAEFQTVAGQTGEFQAQAQGALDSVKSAGQAVTVDPAQKRTLEQAYSALRRGDKATARKRFETAAAADPKDAAVQKQLGYLNLEEGKLAAAASNFEAARGLEPNDYFIALQLGYTYERLQKKEQAREAFNAAMASTDAKIHDAAVAALKPSADAVPTAPSAAPL